MTKHTISAEEILKAYNGKYKYVTMNKTGLVNVWAYKPIYTAGHWEAHGASRCLGNIGITEFQDRTADLCICKTNSAEEDWIGHLCWFCDYAPNLERPQFCRLDILKTIEREKTCSFYTSTRPSHPYLYCRPARPDEIKFFNDDTSEE